MNNNRDREQVRIGIVGLGMAGSIMIPSIVAHPEMVLAGAAEPSDELRERFARDYECYATATIEDLVALPDIDAVYIATPHQMHCDHVLLAAAHGKHVIVEKPMALRVDECDAMIRECEKADVALIVGHTHGFDVPVAAIREIVESGQLGPLRMILSFNYTDFMYRPRRPEELDTSKGGGILFNQVPHQVDMVRTIAGGAKVIAVNAAAGRFDAERATEGAVMAMLSLEGDAHASIVYSGYDHFDSDELHGWVGEGGNAKKGAQGKTRIGLENMRSQSSESVLRNQLYGYGGKLWSQMNAMSNAADHPHFGTLIVSCERGDLRSVPGGIMVYSNSGPEFIKLPPPRVGGGRSEVLDELCDFVMRDRKPFHDGHFGRETLAACLSIVAATQQD